MKVSEMGEVIGKFLRETNSLKEEWKSKTDYQIGELIFNSHPRGELSEFFELYAIAKEYYERA